MEFVSSNGGHLSFDRVVFSWEGHLSFDKVETFWESCIFFSKVIFLGRTVYSLMKLYFSEIFCFSFLIYASCLHIDEECAVWVRYCCWNVLRMLYTCQNKTIRYIPVHLFLICGEKIGGSLFCGKIICGSPHLWEEKTVGEDKNVEREEKSVGWEVENVGGSFGGRKFSSPPDLPPTTFSSPPNLPPTKPSSHLTFFSSPTLFSSQKWGEPQKNSPTK